MPIRYLIVSDDLAKPIPDRMANLATHTVELNVDQMKQSGSAKDWKVVDGQPVLKTQEEKDAEDLSIQKVQTRNLAYDLADKLKPSFITERNGKIYEFSAYSQMLFRTKYNRMGEDDTIRIRVKDSKSVNLNKNNADLLFSLLEAHDDNVETALEDDIDAIKTGDFSLSNLKAIKQEQDALRG